MGTNYYLNYNKCPKCGRYEKKLHIGKSSSGWCFSLHVMPDEGICDLPDWIRLMESKRSSITDEYGRALSVKEMLKIITKRKSRFPAAAWWEKSPFGYSSWDDFHNWNHSEKGPNGLVRYRIGKGCLRHGKGTWDCIVGEFS